MSRSPSPQTRRVPTQRRSKDKYEAILGACADVLRSEGYDGTTTAKIAARAGVGKGALYQYFPNKAQVVAALVGRELDRLWDRTLEGLAGAEALPPLELARHLFRTNVEHWLAERALLTVLFTEVPGVFHMPEVRALEARLAALIASLSDTIPEEQRPERLDRTLYVLTNAITGFMLRLALAEAFDATADELVDELMDLLTGYLDRAGLSGLLS